VKITIQGRTPAIQTLKFEEADISTHKGDLTLIMVANSLVSSFFKLLSFNLTFLSNLLENVINQMPYQDNHQQNTG
jgi:hypothetical protein